MGFTYGDDLVAGQLFGGSSICPFPEASYSKEDPPFSCPGMDMGGPTVLGFWVRTPSGSVSVENDLSSSGLLGVEGDWWRRASYLAVQAGRGATSVPLSSHTDFPPATNFLIHCLPHFP